MSRSSNRSQRSKSLPIYREWRVPETLDPSLAENLVLGMPVLPEVLAVLLRRSGGDPEKARSIMEPSLLALPEVMSLPDLRFAAVRIARAISQGERIVAYSDFDADGVTSAAIVKEALDFAGATETRVYFPSRFADGYGFHASSVREIAAGGPCLFITSDCGITAFDGCDEAVRLGCDVIITDHHLPGERLPASHSVLDPHTEKWAPFGLQELTGAGVAYLLAQALFRETGVGKMVPPSWGHDLLTLSIAGDGYPVLGLNRAWVTSGMKMLGEAKRPGISALLEVAGIFERSDERRLLSFERDVTFGLVPRLNAAGRLSDAGLAFDILVEKDSERAHSLALELNRLNQERRVIEDSIMAQCYGDLEDRDVSGYAVCASRPEWHEGVIGIAASKLREAFGCPVALAGGKGDLLKGSVRGISGFNVVEALSRCADLLEGFGGHVAAGGFTVRREMVDQFFDKFSSVSAELLSATSLSVPLNLDEILTLERASGETLKGFFGLEPFGRGNVLPQAACMDCEIEQVTLMGKARDHLQAVLSKDGVSRKFLWFGRGKEARTIAFMGSVDVAFTPYRSVYMGEEQVTPLLKDIRPSWQRSGLGYEGLVRDVKLKRDGEAPTLIYTWSPHAAECLWLAARKAGLTAAVHLEGQAGALSHEARLTLSGHSGVVISTAPWELGVTAGPGRPVRVLVAHRPVSEADAEKLSKLSALLGIEQVLWGDCEEDARNWLSWTCPEKDSVGLVWKLLKKYSSGGRVPYAHLFRVCREAMVEAGFSPSCPGSFEGGRLLLERSLTILEELGMVEYAETKRVPDLGLRPGSGKISLASSSSYVEGKTMRESAGKIQLFDRRGG